MKLRRLVPSILGAVTLLASLAVAAPASAYVNCRVTITIKLTRTGRRMLTAAKRVRLTAKGAYTLNGGPAVSATRTFTLRR